MNWEDLSPTMDEWAEKSAAPAYDLRVAGADVFTVAPVGYYWHPNLECAAVFAPAGAPADLARCKAAAERAVGRGQVRDLSLRYQELADPYGCWVKVAYSPTLRRVGEALNFFPGQYPGGIPNSPSPAAAMLTSGLVGAGLGWGAGKLFKKFLPEGTGDNLGRTGAILGGALGATPGLVWGAANQSIDKPFNDPSLLAGKVDSESPEGSGAPIALPGAQPETPLHAYIGQLTLPQKRSADILTDVELGSTYRSSLRAFAKAAEDYYSQTGAGVGDADVNIDYLGRTLWQTGASPNLAATTMGAMYAAQQMPDPESRPGWATGRQLGQLAVNTAGDFAKGYLVGVALNALVGTPFRPSTLGLGNAALGVIGAVIPKLFGA